MQTQVL